MTIFGRGGQGGVTLAKLIATAYFLRGKHVQAFGVYAAERSGAPLHAFVRIDDDEITNHNQIREPDHIIVLDRTLIGPHLANELNKDGWVILNSADAPAAFADVFPGRKVATVDATATAVANGLGTRAVPIVNTTMLGAVAKLLGFGLDDIDSALAEVKFGGGNLAAARQAFDAVVTATMPGTCSAQVTRPMGETTGLLDDGVGAMPRIHTGDWATHHPHRRELTPPCNHGCPAGNDVRGFVEAVSKENYDQALAIILKTSPLPGICGRVCPAPCMEACNRNEYDEGIDIREIERFVADHAAWPEPTVGDRDERIAVIGSGPAGLSAAYHLGRLGYAVTLIEQGAELGGVMRTGIPAYRLPTHILDREIDHVLRHGVTPRTNVRIDRRELLALSSEYAGVLVATGLQESRALQLGGPSPEMAIQGIDFLDQVRNGGGRLEGMDVIVLGGGNTAVDAARSARRVGAHRVRIVYRRTRNEMPAIAEEIAEALEEGIVLDELVSPLRLDRDATGTVLRCQRMRLGPPDESGRPRPVPDTTEDAQFDLRCDRVILALGQSADLTILPEGSKIQEGGELLELSTAPIFAVGDFASNEGTVTAAIGNGRRAAWHIHRTLSGEELFAPEPPPVAGPEEITMHVFSHAPAEPAPMVPATDRVSTFCEVRAGYRESACGNPAVAEAQRCFSCGVCNFCDTCQTYCPEGILRRDGDGYRFEYDYCKGCGVCVTACPRAVIYMAEL